MTSSRPNALTLALQWLVVRTARGPLFRVWELAYLAAASAAIRYLTRGEPGASSYLRSGLGVGELVPGISDIDLAFVLEDDPRGADVAAARVRKRYERLVHAVPFAQRIVDVPAVYEQGQVHELAGATFATWGLDGRGGSEPVYPPGPARLNRCRLLERPGLYGDFDDWRLRSGRQRLPASRPRDLDATLLAAWQELSFWWRFGFEASVEPNRIHVPRLCVKLIAESARVRLWLERGERLGGRIDVLRRFRDAVPEEAAAAETALDLVAHPRAFPDPPVDVALGCLLRQTRAVAEIITTHATSTGRIDVQLRGTEPVELLDARPISGSASKVVVHPPAALPLCDWRGLAAPDHIEDGFVRAPGSAAEPHAVATAALARRGGSYSALYDGRTLIFPLPLGEAPKPRRLACSVSDPVSFALLEGRSVASFSQVRGWAAADVARRAVAEQRPRLDGTFGDGDGVRGIRSLLGAARAAMFLESLEDGNPELAVTISATADRLGQRSPAARVICDEVRATLAAEPAPATVVALRKLVEGLPAFGDPRGAGP